MFDYRVIEELLEIAFADDKAIFVPGNSRKELEIKGQAAIDSLLTWCQQNKLSVSEKKTG